MRNPNHPRDFFRGSYSAHHYNHHLPIQHSLPCPSVDVFRFIPNPPLIVPEPSVLSWRWILKLCQQTKSLYHNSISYTYQATVLPRPANSLPYPHIPSLPYLELFLPRIGLVLPSLRSEEDGGDGEHRDDRQHLKKEEYGNSEVL